MLNILPRPLTDQRLRRLSALSRGRGDFDELFYPEPNWSYAHLDPDATYEEGNISATAELLETIPLEMLQNRGSRNWNGYASGFLEGTNQC